MFRYNTSLPYRYIDIKQVQFPTLELTESIVIYAKISLGRYFTIVLCNTKKTLKCVHRNIPLNMASLLPFRQSLKNLLVNVDEVSTFANLFYVMFFYMWLK